MMRIATPFLFASLTLGAPACVHSDKQMEAQAAQPQPESQVPAGTEFTARLNQSLSSQTSSPGQYVLLTIVDAMQDPAGQVVAPAGSIIQGRITSVDHGPTQSLRLSFSTLQTPQQGRIPIAATIKTPASAQAPYRTEEIYSPSLPYNAVLLPPSSGQQGNAVGGGPLASTPAAIALPAGTPFRMVLIKALTPSAEQPAPSSSSGAKSE